MPDEYKGKELTNSGMTKYTPRQWTNEEITWCMKLKDDGYSVAEIADSIDRDIVQTSIKLKRLTKKNDTYNHEHLADKYMLNDEFFNVVKPEIVLDAFTGVKHYWSDKCPCVTNDIDESIKADYHMDALKMLCNEYMKGNKYDLIDLDPYGSAYDCFDLAIKMAKKGLIITYGEMGHKRFKRLDYVRNAYQIDDLNDFTIENLIIKTQEIARHNHKDLIVYQIGNWRNIARVYFLIKPIKITEQWDKEEEFPEDINDYLTMHSEIEKGETVVPLYRVMDALEHYYYE